MEAMCRSDCIQSPQDDCTGMHGRCLSTAAPGPRLDHVWRYRHPIELGIHGYETRDEQKLIGA